MLQEEKQWEEVDFYLIEDVKYSEGRTTNAYIVRQQEKK